MLQEDNTIDLYLEKEGSFEFLLEVNDFSLLFRNFVGDNSNVFKCCLIIC